MKNTEITIAANKSKTGDELHTANLYRMISGNVGKDWIEYSDGMRELYKTNRIEEYQKYKEDAPILMPSGLFIEAKGKNNLIAHSGYLSVDIDRKDNDSIDNWSLLKKQISRIANVAYVGHSLSGESLWGLIPVNLPEDIKQAQKLHEDHTAALIEDFWRYGIRLDDSCKNVNRLRYYAYDPEGYINLNAIPYTKKIQKKKYEYRKREKGNGLTPWDAYNNDSSDPHLTLLQNEGWKLIESRSNSDDLYFTRPGKPTGISAEYCKSRKWFYVYTSSTCFEPGKHYKPFEIFTHLTVNGDFNKGARELKKIGYGK